MHTEDDEWEDPADSKKIPELTSRSMSEHLDDPLATSLHLETNFASKIAPIFGQRRHFQPVSAFEDAVDRPKACNCSCVAAMVIVLLAGLVVASVTLTSAASSLDQYNHLAASFLRAGAGVEIGAGAGAGVRAGAGAGAGAGVVSSSQAWHTISWVDAQSIPRHGMSFVWNRTHDQLPTGYYMHLFELSSSHCRLDTVRPVARIHLLATAPTTIGTSTLAAATSPATSASSTTSDSISTSPSPTATAAGAQSRRGAT